MTSTQDIKLLFPPYDCQPNQRRFDKFQNDLLASGGNCDVEGWSLADCLQRTDAGAITPLGAHAPGTGGIIPANGGGVAMDRSRGLRRARLKKSFSHLILHIDHPEVKAVLSKAPYLGNGPVALDYLRQRCSTPGNTGQQQDMQMEWCSLTIKKDIGINENSLINLDLRLTSIGSEMQPEYAYGNDVQCEKILREISNSSALFMVEALRELNAVEGRPGLPNVRLFQGPTPVDANGAATGEPRPRNKVALLSYFHAMWSAAVRARQLPVLKPQVHDRPGGASRSTVDSGMSARAVETGLAGRETSSSPATTSQSLSSLAAAGVEVRRGDATTTDFSKWDSLLAAWEEEEDEDFSIVQCYDADDTSSHEMVCHNCRGLGHPGARCPSAKKQRTLDYTISMLNQAKKKADERGAARGDAKGGKRPAPRGQQAPFKPFPRRFQQKTNPHRRFLPAKAKSAEAEDDDEDSGFEEEVEGAGSAVDTEGAGSAVETDKAKSASAVSKEVTAVLERDAPRPQMPTAFQLDDHFFESGQLATAVEGDLAAVPAVQEQPLGAPAAQPAWRWPGLGFATVAFLAAVGIAQMADGGRTLQGWALGAAEKAGEAVAAVMVLGAATRGLIVTLLLLSAVGLAGASSAVPRAQLSQLPPSATLQQAPTILTGVVQPQSPILPKFDMIESPPKFDMPKFDMIETAHDIKAVDLEVNQNYTAYSISGEERVIWTVDSGATAYIISEDDEWMLDEITDENPSIGVEIADGVQLATKKVGIINKGPIELGKIGLRTLSPQQSEENEEATYLVHDDLAYPQMTRVLVVRGIKRGTRLAGVRPLMRDGIHAYFNDDNEAKIANCLRLTNGTYCLFLGDDKHYDVAFRIAPEVTPSPGAETGLASRDSRRTPIEVHASLMHASSKVVRRSNLTMAGFDMDDLDVDASDCPGCRLGKTRRPDHRKSTAPSRGGTRRPWGSGNRKPSTTGYSFFGQRVDTDISIKMPPSWPHKFTGFLDLCDRHTAETFYYMVQSPNSSEVAGALETWTERVKHRLTDGQVHRLHGDNDMAYNGPDMQAWARQMVQNATARVPHDPDTNPVAERQLGIAKSVISASLAHAGAPECLWPWSLSQYENVRYFLSTESHSPPVSPYAFSHPEAPPADVSWMKPLYCDVTVSLAKQDRAGKLSYTGADGCYLGHDFKRNCSFVYLPSLHRIASFTVTDWRVASYTIVKSITSDTPVEYREPNDLRYGEVTASLMPRRIAGPRAQSATTTAQLKEGAAGSNKEGATVLSKEGAAIEENRRRIEQGVQNLVDHGDDAVLSAVLCEVNETKARELVGYEQSLAAVEFVLHGPDSAKQVVEGSSLVKIGTVAEAMDSPYWAMIKEAMEAEITGKLANKFATVVPREPGMAVMKVRWIIDVHLNPDGTIKRIKTRLVGCGYSQVEGRDYDDVFAPTLPGLCLRLFLSIVAEKNYDTDQIDAIKAFTQAYVDRLLHCEMPIGFQIPGHVLLLHKCLEGIKQGSALWFKKNKWAWNKCGLDADMSEPNLYTHASLPIVAAVFADDVGVGYAGEAKHEYLAIRGEYAKLINIDSPSPDMVRPLSLFVGCEIERNRQSGTLKVTQQAYMRKLAERFSGEYTLNDLPYGASKTKRDALEALKPGTEDSAVDKAGYLVKLGSIGWPTCMTRPECAFTYSVLCSLSMFPTAEAHAAALHMVGYLIATAQMGPVYGGRLKIPLGLKETPTWFAESSGLYAVTDSSFGKSPRPYGGHVVIRTNAAVDWSAKAFKTVVPDSTAEAETAQASRATKALLAARNVLSGARYPAKGPSFLLGDNSAMVNIIKRDGPTQRTRYFERATMLVKYAVLRLFILVKLVPTKEMIADVFTKAVDKDTFVLMRKHLLNLGGDVANQVVHGRATRMARKLADLINLL